MNDASYSSYQSDITNSFQGTETLYNLNLQNLPH